MAELMLGTQPVPRSAEVPGNSSVTAAITRDQWYAPSIKARASIGLRE